MKNRKPQRAPFQLACILVLVACGALSCGLMNGSTKKEAALDEAELQAVEFLRQTPYYRSVQKTGSAAELIFAAQTLPELQSLLGNINREASLSVGVWERQVREYHKRNTGASFVAEKVDTEVSPVRNELRDLQQKCMKALSQKDMNTLKQELFLLDSFANELAGKLGKTRPLIR